MESSAFMVNANGIIPPSTTVNAQELITETVVRIISIHYMYEYPLDESVSGV